MREPVVDFQFRCPFETLLVVGRFKLMALSALRTSGSDEFVAFNSHFANRAAIIRNVYMAVCKCDVHYVFVLCVHLCDGNKVRSKSERNAVSCKPVSPCSLHPLLQHLNSATEIEFA